MLNCKVGGVCELLYSFVCYGDVVYVGEDDVVSDFMFFDLGY